MPGTFRVKAIFVTSVIVIGFCGTLLHYWLDAARSDPRANFARLAEENGSGTADTERAGPPDTGAEDAGQDIGLPGVRVVRAIDPSSRPTKARGVLDFGEEGTVEVTLTSVVPHSAGVPRSVPLNEVFDELLERAEAGDAPATRSLYERMESCRNLLKGGSTLAKSLDRLRTESLFYGPMGRRRVSPDEIPRREDQLRRSFARCGDVRERIESNTARIEVLLEAAAEHDLLAMRALLRKNRADPAARMSTLQWMWSLGYAEALTEISAVFRSAASGIGAAEARVHDYAYYRAFTEIMAAAWNAGDPGRNAMRLHSMESLLAQKAGQLSPSQQSASDRLAITLVRENPNCCRGIFAFEANRD